MHLLRTMSVVLALLWLTTAECFRVMTGANSAKSFMVKKKTHMSATPNHHHQYRHLSADQLQRSSHRFLQKAQAAAPGAPPLIGVNCMPPKSSKNYSQNVKKNPYPR